MYSTFRKLAIMTNIGCMHLKQQAKIHGQLTFIGMSRTKTAQKKTRKFVIISS
jgi:hypothetical protein